MLKFVRHQPSTCVSASICQNPAYVLWAKLVRHQYMYSGITRTTGQIFLLDLIDQTTAHVCLLEFVRHEHMYFCWNWSTTAHRICQTSAHIFCWNWSTTAYRICQTTEYVFLLDWSNNSTYFPGGICQTPAHAFWNQLGSVRHHNMYSRIS